MVVGGARTNLQFYTTYYSHANEAVVFGNFPIRSFSALKMELPLGE